MWIDKCLPRTFATATIVVVAVAVSLSGCHSTSPSPAKEESRAGLVSIAELKSFYSNGYPHTFTEPLIIDGVVISSDRCANFYKTLVIEDPSGGIELRIDKEQLFIQYSLGDSLRVNCAGLTIGSYGGTLQLGSKPSDGYQTSPIDAVDQAKHIVEHGFAPTRPQGRLVRVAQLNASMISTLVSFEGARMAKECNGLAWCETDTATSRPMIDERGDTIEVYTSPYATFANQTMPNGTFDLSAIVGYFNQHYQIRIVDPYDLIEH